MSDTPRAPKLQQLRVQWTGNQDVPIEMANQFLVQVDAVEDRPDILVLSVGQVMPPPLVGSPEENAAELEEISFVPVRTLARFSITPSRLAELVELLQRAQETFDKGPVGEEAAS